MNNDRRIVATPEDTGGKNVFIINDIDLIIPPSQIEIRKEDLTFRYRTLRTKSSTKVPTGNGQCTIHLTIPFTRSTIFQLHRLITEVRNSPFCYIDNRFIRESIVPEWPFAQNMAFTVTGLNVTNMPNSSDSYILQLDALWFNYFPFMHNYLFRREWQTNWLRETNSDVEAYTTRTIGWHISSDGQRQYYPNVIGVMNNSLPEGNTLVRPGTTVVGDTWSVIQDQATNKHQKRTIFDMEISHPGADFDLLPLPNNMMPSEVVSQPRDSHIFVRYMNFLQRDALLKNFGIDVRADLLEYEEIHGQPGLLDSIFSVGEDAEGLPVVIGLHSDQIPRSLRHKWIKQMMSHTGDLKLHFHAYKEIRLPQKWTDSLENKKNSAIVDLDKRLRAIKRLERETSTEGDRAAIPVCGAPYPITSQYSPRRFHPEDKIYKPHHGIDIGAPFGTPLIAPEGGRIISANDKDEGAGGRFVKIVGDSGATWLYLHMDLVRKFAGERVERDDVIGTVGDSGRVSGPHLHLQYKPPGGTTYVDPYPVLLALADERAVEAVEEGTAPIVETESAFDYSNMGNHVELTDIEQLEQQTVSEAKKALELTDDEAAALSELLGVLESEGWSYYEGDTTVTNVWKKLFSLQISHGGLNEIPPEFSQAGIILTSISGSLSHIVARIPVLSHEFPTQQHLGSIEPEYQMEFAVLDDQSDLEGISGIAQMVQSVRSMLQSNSRKFRAVLDSWCVSVDSFITRFLGSYQENDFQALESEGYFSDYKLKKRCIVGSSYEGTVEGNPGLSTILMSLQETNPYEQENLVSTAPVLNDKEEARRLVLQALHKLDLADQYKDLIFPILITQLAKANLSVDNQADFGKVFLRSFEGQITNTPEERVFLSNTGQGNATSLLIRQNGSGDSKIFERLGIPTEEFIGGDNQTYLKLDPAVLESYSIFYDNLGWARGAERQVSVPDYGSDWTAISEIANPAGYTGMIYDMSDLIRANPDLSQIPLYEFLALYGALLVTLDTAEQVLAEENVHGLGRDYIINELYGLPTEGKMWKYWLRYIEEVARTSNSLGPAKAVDEFRSNVNRSQFPFLLEDMQGDPDLDSSAQAAYAGLGPWRARTAALSDLEPGAALWDIYYMSAAGLSSSYEQADIFQAKYETALDRLVNRYMTSFPIQFSFPESLKGKYAYLLGNVLGDTWKGERGKVPALDSMHEYLRENAVSCGNLTYDFVRLASDNPMWASNYSDQLQALSTRGGAVGAVQYPVAAAALLGSSVMGRANPFGDSQQAVTLYNQAASLGLSLLPEGAANTLAPQQAVGTRLNFPFLFPDTIDHEQVKLRYIKGLLAAFADDILGSGGLLDILGLGHLLTLDESRDYSGLECYPDLDLPNHPYYETRRQVAPDFYMWNIYEDGGAFTPERLNQMYEKLNIIVDNCYESMKRMESGEHVYDERTDTLTPEVGIDDPLVLVTQMNTEGTDGHQHAEGPMASPYYPTKGSKTAVDKWKKEAPQYGPASIYSDKPSEVIPEIRLANAEGPFGAAGGTHYPQRVGNGTYNQLREQLYQTTQLFGSAEGYMNREIDEKNTPDVYSAIEGSDLQRPPEAGHFFDPKSLKHIAKDSTKDLISQKMSLKRGFPTYKLYFVEEDEYETRFLNFDDFYSYNAVKQITVVQSRKSAADHAVVTLQNISGTLDGTRRNVISDLDYFSSTASKKMSADGDYDSSSLSNDPVTTGTSSEQPFGSVVLRPGLNVQLRMGYSNDPDSLHVMLSGRVVDVTWNKTGDLAEILIQSFGTELSQVIKGTARDGVSSKTFYTTHELLGTMMLEPEVTHFGRWEFGQLFMLGEAKDYKLDFTEYSREGYMGRFGVTNWVGQWIMNHPWLTLGSVIAVGAASQLLPFGRIFSQTSLAGKLGFSMARGAGGYRAMFTAAEEGLEVGAEAAAKAAAKTKAAGEAVGVLREFANGSKAVIKSAEYARILTTKVDEAVLEFHKLVNADDLDGAVAALAKVERFVQQTTFKSRWMGKPWVEIGGAGFMSAAGWKPFGTFLNLYTGVPIKAGVTVLGSAFILDVAANLGKAAYERTIGGAAKFFARTKAQFFLTPQDDNLFPPHPKDYMTLDQTLKDQIVQLGLHNASLLLTGDSSAGSYIYRFFNPDELISKKVYPEACQYQLVSTTIWEVFHEMSLRHPGWIYAARPYGNRFRYTMFFGLPGQRYWARPATNAFIERANKLRRFLTNQAADFAGEGLINEFEFTNLYGSETLGRIKDEIDKNQFTVSSSSTITVEDIKKAALERRMGSMAIEEYLRAVQLRFEPFRRYHLLSSERDIVWNGIMGSEQAVTNAVDVTYYTEPDNYATDFSGSVSTAIFKAHSFIPESKLRIAPVRWYNCKGYGMAMRYAMGELMHRMKEMYRGEIIVLGNPRIRPWDVAILLDSYNDMVGPVEVEQVVHTFSHETGYLTEIKPSAVVIANEISGWPLIEGMKMFAMAVDDIHKRYKGIYSGGNDVNLGVADTGDYKLAGDIVKGALLGTTTAAGGLGSLVGTAGGVGLGMHAITPAESKFENFMQKKYSRTFGAGGPTIESMFKGTAPPDLDKVDAWVEDVVSSSLTAVGIAGYASTLSGIALGGKVFRDSVLRTFEPDGPGGSLLGGLNSFTRESTTDLFLGGADAKGVPHLDIIGGKKTAGGLFLKNPLAWAAGAAFLGGLFATGATSGSSLVINQIDFPGTAFLLGGTVLFLQCLRNDAVIVVPLTKSGNPIVAGLAYNDPAMMWKNVLGVLTRMASDTIYGTTDLLALYKRYGSEMWERVNQEEVGFWSESVFGSTNSASLESLTGE